MEVLSLGVKGPGVELDGALKSSAKERANAVITVRNPVTQHYAEQIADLAINHKLLSLGKGNDFAAAGTLLTIQPAMLR